MSKTANTLRVLAILSKHGLVKTSELSRIIGVNERQIRVYVDCLNEAGIRVFSKSGPKGGFFLVDDVCPLCHNKLEKDGVINNEK